MCSTRQRTIPRVDYWRSVLRVWLDTRTALWREFGVPGTKELHATEYVNGRGRIPKSIQARHIHDSHEYWKDFGREVAGDCLEMLRCTEGLLVGSVYRSGKPKESASTKSDLYADLVARFEVQLADRDSLGLIFMDGDGSDSSCRTTRRGLALAKRRAIDDAVHIDSSGSQLLPMADLVAGSASSALDQHPKNEFAVQW
ncbi:hypothetical protein AB0C34_06355 [Nocardia sp. NPDC049220]|uniref:hypothetical protein n=1 Tax=Nocardia sp. NPDC049220 TaxID=3155273 RepID=UPI0033CD8E71